ncbi:electron transport complex subunit RsxC [Sphingobacterium sp. Mn56C]
MKKKTKHQGLQTLDDAADFYLPLAAYRNTMMPVVEIGATVLKYELLAESQGPFASKIHAPVSGTVAALLEIDGKQVLQLKNDYQDTPVPTAPVDAEALDIQSFRQLLLDYGIQGAGGSQFPTQLKYNLEEYKIHTLIFNGVECEPYLTADRALLSEKTVPLLKAAQVIQKIVAAERIVFAIEKQNRQVKPILLKQAATLGVPIEVQLLPDTYPQGGELQLIKSVVGKELRKGSIPAQHGILVNNIGTLWAIYKAIFEGSPNVERVVTVSGNACETLGNYTIKYGTPVAHILKATGNPWNPEAQTLVLGGAMMGKAISSGTTAIHKGSGGLLLLKKQAENQQNCIKCGLCVDVCPQRLMPLEFVRFNQQGNQAALQQYHLGDCIECGACAYVCPSHVPLMENIFSGKAQLFTSG